KQGRGTTSLRLLVGKESLAQNGLEAGEREPRSVARGHIVRLGLGQVHFGIEQVENRRRPTLVTGLLNAEALARGRPSLGREPNGRARRLIRIVRRGDVVLHRPLHVVPNRTRNVTTHARLRTSQLASP